LLFLNNPLENPQKCREFKTSLVVRRSSQSS